jgi:hypothetical protein
MRNALAADVPSGPPERKSALFWKLAFPIPGKEAPADNRVEVKLFGSRKYGDAVAPEGPYPKVVADRDCHGA